MLCIIKEKWKLRSIGRPKLYNLFGSTLGVLQVCHCKKGVLGRDYGLEFYGNVIGCMTEGTKDGGGSNQTD